MPNHPSHSEDPGFEDAPLEDIKSIATAAVLVTDATLSDAGITSLTRRIFEKGRDYSALGSAQGAQISAATSRAGLLMPLHAACCPPRGLHAARIRQAQDSPQGLSYVQAHPPGGAFYLGSGPAIKRT